MKKLTILAIACQLIITGCSIRDHGLFLEPVPTPHPVRITLPPTQSMKNTGSIFMSNNISSTMISDTKAYRINDIVIVSITESTTATNSATTSTDKKTNRDLGIPSLLGLESTSFPKINSSITPSSLVSTSSAATHAGTGSTKRTGQFQGSLAARVLQVLPNGFLVVQGYKNIQVNGELEKIYLTGIVNPLLIAKDHTIQSNQIADLELFYGGRGIVGGSQNPGWLHRLLDVVWPF